MFNKKKNKNIIEQSKILEFITKLPNNIGIEKNISMLLIYFFKFSILSPIKLIEIVFK